MARKGRAKAPKERRPKQPLPPPLPPETRTIGQLVAETVRFYNGHFWASLALGIGPAAVTVASYLIGKRPLLGVVGTAWIVLMAVSFVAACVLVSGRRPARRVLLRATVLGMVIAVPPLFLVFLLILPALMWLAFFGLAVPAVVVEGRSFRQALARGRELALADYVHALGSLCTLALVGYITQVLLFALLHSASQQVIEVAGFLASLVISPIFFLGTALLYYDQAARVSSRRPRRERSRDADVPDADDAHRSRAANPAVESRPAARGEP